MVSKLLLDIKRINTKLVQLKQIHSILEQIDVLYANPSVNRNFKIMVDQYYIRSFPKKVSLLFAPDYASSGIITYLEDIQNGSLTKELYNAHLYNYLLESKFVENFITNNSIDTLARNYIQYLFKSKATTSEDIEKRLSLLWADMLNWNSKPLLGIKKGLDRWFIPYDEFEIYLEYAKYNIGLFMFETLHYLADFYINQSGGKKTVKVTKTRRRNRLLTDI